VSRALRVAALTAVLWAAPAGAAVSLDALTTRDSGRFVATFSFDHTVGAGSNRFLVVAVIAGNLNTAVTSVSYGGLPLARIDRSSGRDVAADLWGLVAPPVGLHTVTIALDSANDRPLATALSYQGVDQTTPVGTAGRASGSGGAVAVSVPAAPGDYLLDAAGAWTMTRSAPSAIADPGQRELWNVANARDTVVMGSETIAVGAATTMSWMVSGQPFWASLAVAINAAAPLDATPDGGLPPGGSDAAEAARPADGPVLVEGGEDAAADVGLGKPQDAAADRPPGVRVTSLRVGSACAVSGAGPRALPAALVLAALARLATRRRRSGPGALHADAGPLRRDGFPTG